MPSIRRTLSPVPRSGISLNPETGPFGSPLSHSQGSPLPGRIRPSLSASPDSRSVLYKLEALILGIAFQRSSHILERPKSRGQAWRNFLFPMTVCFMIGLIIGLAQFVSWNLSMHSAYEHQAFSFQMIPESVKPLIDIRVVKNNDTSDINVGGRDPGTETLVDSQATKSPVQNSDLMIPRLLIIVTPTHARPLQSYYLNRLVQTLKLIPPPLLWIVVEMNSQSDETADMLRRTGVMYRHLVCNKNLTGGGDRRIHQKNVALSHIETHHLDGVVYFADDDVIYSADLFEEMRQIRLFGTWMVAKLKRGQSNFVPEGPVCNGTRVIGWHADEATRKFWRFHVDISGFAFNSTILWDPNRSVLKPIRQIDAVKQTFQVSSFVRQVVEDETQMECLLQGCSRIMAWHLHL